MNQEQESSSASPTLSLRAVFFYWLPVLVALAVFGQVALLGLRPALTEERRLADATTLLLERQTAALEESARLSRLLQAQQDPVFLERERRDQRIDPDAPARGR